MTGLELLITAQSICLGLGFIFTILAVASESWDTAHGYFGIAKCMLLLGIGLTLMSLQHAAYFPAP